MMNASPWGGQRRGHFEPRLDGLHRRVVFPEVGNRVTYSGRIDINVRNLEANGQCGERLSHWTTRGRSRVVKTCEWA